MAPSAAFHGRRLNRRLLNHRLLNPAIQTAVPVGESPRGTVRDSGPENEGGSTRATVSPATRTAPALRKAREHASSVAPVVNTSSTSSIRNLSTLAPDRVS